MNRKVFFVMVVFAAILLPMILVGQEKKDSGGVNVTGCFNKGADADHYVLKDEKGKEYVVTGDAGMLARHANNHRVTITGNMAKEKDKDVLKATNLQMLCASRKLLYRPSMGRSAAGVITLSLWEGAGGVRVSRLE